MQGHGSLIALKPGLYIVLALVMLLALVGSVGVMTIRFVDILPPLIQGSAFTSATLLPRIFSIIMMLATIILGCAKQVDAAKSSCGSPSP